MALLAESLVEEWLNRDGYFTIRGLKHGVGEMDLLAVRPQQKGVVVGMHVEVQASFRPIGYIAKRTKSMIAADGGNASSARARKPRQIDACAREWVQNKFQDQAKIKLRNRLWPGVQWSFHLVHAVVREPRELRIFEKEGVTCHPFHELLASLSRRSKQSFSGSAGGDLAEIVSYYRQHDSKSGR
jgi:Holliday junction resolvase-like predicted endonuclease